jgi:hypothetical protein
MSVVNGPPDSLTAEELAQYLANRPAPEKTVDLPESMNVEREKLNKIKFIIPADSVSQAARFDALCHVRSILAKRYGRDIKADDLEPSIVQDLIGDRCAKETLARVTFAPIEGETLGDTNKKNARRIFLSADHLEQTLQSEEIKILFDLWLITQNELGPRASVLTHEKDIQQLWIDKLKAGAWSLGPLAWLALADARELACSALKTIEEYQRLGLPLLDPSFLESLRGLVSTPVNSDLDSISSGEPAENSSPSTQNETLGIAPDESITPEKALELAAKLRRP